MKKWTTIALVFFSLIGCAQKPTALQQEFEFPQQLREVSGMHYAADGSFWVVEDSGNQPVLYQLDRNGVLISELLIANATNTDWEDLSSDADGNVYIGDFGNNKNRRRDLKIYKIDAADLQLSEANSSQVTSFEYPEQKAFPPKKTELFYDAESFFLLDDYFYIFTKNRSKGFDGSSLVYQVPNKPGHHLAKQIGVFKGCNIYKQCALTSAAVSPDQKTVALLSHSKVWLLENFTPGVLLDGKMTSYNLNHVSQKESIVFGDNHTLFLSDEVDKESGGKVYQLHTAELKAKP